MKKDLLSVYELELADFDKILKKAGRLKKTLKGRQTPCISQGKNAGDDF